jgi:hypothetical protein
VSPHLAWRSRRPGAGGKEQALAVLGARAAAEQVGGDTMIPPGRVGAGLVIQDSLDIDVQDAQRIVAAHVAGISMQEAV